MFSLWRINNTSINLVGLKSEKEGINNDYCTEEEKSGNNSENSISSDLSSKKSSSNHVELYKKLETVKEIK